MINANEYYLKRTRAIAKEIELNVPEDNRAKSDVTVEDLFPYIVSIIADISYQINKGDYLISQDDIVKLTFASKFITSYVQINQDEAIKNKYYLVGAVSGFLSNRLGDSVLLASMAIEKASSIDALFYVLMNVLKNNIQEQYKCEKALYYKRELDNFTTELYSAIKNGRRLEKSISEKLKGIIYAFGNDNEVFAVDLLLAVCKLKCKYSTAAMIKNITIPKKKKKLLIDSNAILSEFWPAQRLMLEKGFFEGKSGVIQLPTGAGKTKSISLCIFSFFSSTLRRISLVISPFRALCRETSRTIQKDLKFDKAIKVVEFSDVLKNDYILPDITQNETKYAIVTTPEKLLYVLRHNPEFADNIGQLIFDEGHMFGDATRGANYELLIASILEKLKEKPQIIMISAIVSGVDKINNWISNGTGSIISESSISTTEKYTASLSARRVHEKLYYYLDYLNSNNLNEIDFYVPRLIKEENYLYKNKQISFPDPKKDISIATLIRLSKFSNCALYTGKKDKANSIAKRIIEINKYVDLSALSDRNNSLEQQHLARLLQENYGETSTYYKASLIGVFMHHAGISDGIKASVEYALSKELISSVICTSTLSQGVNLPIKYLIIDSIYTGKNTMSGQEFKNLIGRVGRSGKYTEGTVIYTDPNSYFEKNREWKKYAELYNDADEKCNSQLLWICGHYKNIDLVNLVSSYYQNCKNNESDIISKLPGNTEDKIDTWSRIKTTLGNIESFLAQWPEQNEDSMRRLIAHTLIFQYAGDSARNRLLQVFDIINNYLVSQIPDSTSRVLYSKSLLSIEDYSSLGSFVSNIQINDELTDKLLKEICLTQIYKHSNNKALKRVSLNDINDVASLWIKGVSYGDIFEICKDKRVIWGKKTRSIKLEDITAICDTGFNYSATIILNAIIELLNKKGPEYEVLVKTIDEYLLQLKYGLPSKAAIHIYQNIINDRQIAQKISKIIDPQAISKDAVFSEIRANKTDIEELLHDYPSYFLHQFNSLFSDS